MALFIRYCVSGASGIAVQTAALWLWVSGFGLHSLYLEGVVFAFVCGVAAAFLLQKFWTFAGRQQRHATHHQVFMYLVIGLCNLGLSALFSWAAKMLFEHFGFDYFHGWYLLVQLIIAGIVAVVSFTANYLLTFRELQPPVVG